jgi:protein-tyrosine-phosphatase
MTRILFVCTANQARSAFAEAVLRSMGSEATTGEFTITSAGTKGVDGRPCDTNTVIAAKALGYDVREHRATRLDDSHLRNNDLIVCMTNEHLRHGVGLFTKAWPRTFTLIDLARRAATIGPRSGGDFDAYVGELHQGRNIKDAWIDGGTDDVPDPIERSLAGHQRILAEVLELTTSIGHLLR